MFADCSLVSIIFEGIYASIAITFSGQEPVRGSLEDGSKYCWKNHQLGRLSKISSLVYYKVKLSS
jgi:hypothetical protein